MDALEAPRTILRVTARLYQRIMAQIILLLGFVGLVYFLVYFLLNSSYAGEIFDQAVNSQFRGRIAWTRIKWGPLPWKIDILEPVLSGPDDRRVISAERIQVNNIELLALLDGQIAASDIRIERPVVYLRARPHPEGADEYGRPGDLMNISEMFLPPAGETVIDDGQPGGVGLQFTDVEITDARFVLDQPDILIEVDGANIRSARFGLADGPESMTIGATQVDFLRAQLSLPAEDLTVPVVRADSADLMRWTVANGLIRQFAWRDQSFTVQSLTGTVRGDPLKVRNAKMDLDRPGSPALRAQVDLTVASLARHLVPLGIDGIDGQTTLTVKASGELDSIDAQVHARGDTLSVMGNPAKNWDLTARLHPDGTARLQTLEANAFDGRVYATAEWGLETGHATAQVELRDVNPALVPDVQGVREARRWARGPLDLRLRVHGRSLLDPSERTASVTLDWEHMRLGPTIAGVPRQTEFNLIAALNGDALIVQRLHLDAGINTVQLAGQLGVADQKGRLTGLVQLPELSGIGAALDLPIDGALTASFEVTGDITAPLVDAQVSGRDLQYADYPTAQLDAAVRYTPAGLMVDDVDLRTNAGEVMAKGTIDLRGTPRFDMRVDLGKLDVAAAPLDLDIAGTVETVRPVRISGPANNPRIEGAVRVRDPRYERLGLDEILIDGAWQGTSATLNALSITGPDGLQIAANGSVDLARQTFDGELDAQRVPLSLADAFVENPLGLRGYASVQLKGAGPFDDPSGTGRLRLTQLGYDRYDFKDSSLAVAAEDGRVAINGRLIDLLEVDATVPMAPGKGLARATLAFTDLTPAKAGFPSPDYRATASGTVRASYDLFGGAGLDTVDVELTTLKAEYFQRDLRGQVVRTPMLAGANDPTILVEADTPLRLSYRHGVGVFDQVALRLNGQPMTLVGTVSADMMDVALRTALDLQLAQPFVVETFNEIDGLMYVSIDLIGPLTDPNINGWVRLESLDLVPRTAVIARDLHLEEPVEFAITSPIGPLPMQDGKPATGVFTLSMPEMTRPQLDRPAMPNRFRLQRDDASVVIDQVSVEFERFALERLYVALDASSLALNVPEVMRGTFDATDLSVELFQHREAGRGAETRLRIAGDIGIEEAEYFADVVSSNAINQGVTDNFRGRSRAQSVSVFERVPLLKRLMLDVRLHGDDEIRVRSNLAVISTDLELKMDVRAKGFLVGTPSDAVEDQLQLTGTVDILDDVSTITYQRRVFDVNEGVINLGGQNFMSADISASTTFRLRTDQAQAATAFDTGAGGNLREEEVTLEIAVTMPTRDSDPKITPTLSSSSGASKIEVLTLLLTGRYPSDLTGAASAAPATEVLLGPVLSLIERPLEETLNLNLSLTPDATGTLFIDADKALSRRLRLYSRTPVGNDAATNPQITGLEYRINNLLTWELTNEQLGNNNATSGRLRLRLEMD